MGLSVEIGDQLLELICAQIATWVKTIGRTVPVALNLSDTEIRQAGLGDRIQRTAAAYGHNPCTLEVEITERVLVRDRPAARELLAGLHDLGMRVAIDDFGTGYSSLSVLKGLPIDTLKVDRSFISDITSEPEGSALTAAIIHMGHDLGMTVVAEGVETPEQLRLLRQMKCDEVQGFLFSKAVSGDAFATMLSPKTRGPRDQAGSRYDELAVQAGPR
jgi:EAL domain-containing protein (putative c-di-GMP-specific phosphodiesterase class I)